jgi:type I restriction enzyme, S subunit
MDDWQDIPLGEMIELKRGYDLTGGERQPGTIPVITSSGPNGTHSVAKVEGPGVVIGRYGTLGQVFFVQQDFWPHNTTLYVKDFKGNDVRFVVYLLKTINVQTYSDKAAVPGLNRNHLHMEPVRRPPLVEQRAIAHVLGTLDDKIDLNRRMNETLESMARALFKSWFVDFDPVRAKMEGRQPAGMDAGTAALFPAAFEDSPLGEIPKGWTIAHLPELIEVNPSRRLAHGSVAPYLDMQNVPTAGHRPSNWIGRPFGSGMRFSNGDTLVARITPCLENGKTAFVDFLKDSEIGWGSTEFIVLRPKPPIPPEYAYYLARSDEFRAFAIANMTGTSGRQRVPANCFDSFDLVAAPAGIAAQFGPFVRSVMRQISANVEQSRTLATIRDALLPKLLSGEIKAGEV